MTEMAQHSDSLAALIGSRICHDLISPIGAVNNGLELMSLSGASNGPEIDLVTESATSANSRIRLFRLAFGVASPDQITRADEITSIWSGVFQDNRIKLKWTGPSSLSRLEARAILLACLCTEVALPQGGQIQVDQSNGMWRITASNTKLNFDPELWTYLKGSTGETPIQPAQVQFLLLPHYLFAMQRRCSYDHHSTMIVISF